MNLLQKTGIRPADIILVLCLLLVSLSVFIPFQKKQPEQEILVIQKDQKQRYSFVQNQQIPLDCGGMLQIENGAVFVKDMPCPDKICENSGRISQPNESILCLPNHVAIRIVPKETPDLDGISE